MAENNVTLEYETDEKRTITICSNNAITQTFDVLQNFGLSPMRLPGHENLLFQKHISFLNSPNELKGPYMDPSINSSTLVTIDYYTESIVFKEKISALLVVLEKLVPLNSSETSDIDVLGKLMFSYVEPPNASYAQIFLENGTKNHLVGGKIDYVVGSLCNGDKPVMRMQEKSKDEQFRRVFLGSLLEGKKTDVSLYPLRSENSTFTETNPKCII